MSEVNAFCRCFINFRMSIVFLLSYRLSLRDKPLKVSHQEDHFKYQHAYVYFKVHIYYKIKYLHIQRVMYRFIRIQHTNAGQSDLMSPTSLPLSSHPPSFPFSSIPLYVLPLRSHPPSSHPLSSTFSAVGDVIMLRRLS